MNRPALIVSIVVLAGLGAFLAFRPEPDTRPDVENDGKRQFITPRYMEDIGGIKADFSDAEFHVGVEARMDGARSVLEFTVTEAKGWGALEVHVTFRHTIRNEETGEWAPDPALEPREFICKAGPLRFGEPLVDSLVLEEWELERIGGVLGESEQWSAEVNRVHEVRKPR